MYKKIFVFVILCILIINIYTEAATVSDNDGSAFITKAEFDSLKNTFQSQIDTYNSGIDNKIDSAIASYLSGIVVTTGSTDYYKSVKSAFANNNPIFLNNVSTTQSANKAEINVPIYNRYYVKTNIFPDTDYEVWSGNFSTTTSPYWHVKSTRIVPNALADQGTNQNYNFCEAVDYEIDATHYAMSLPNPGTSGSYTSTWVRKNSGYSVGTSIWTDTTRNPENKLKGMTEKDETQDGEGKAYIIHKTAAGNYTVREYASSVWPICNGTVYFHSYGGYYAKNYADWLSYHGSDNAMKLSTKQTLTFDTYTDWGTYAKESSVGDETEENKKWGEISIRLYKVTDGLDYSKYLWGKTKTSSGDIKVYCLLNNVLPTANSKDVTLTASTYDTAYFYDSAVNKKTQTNDLPENKLTYYYPSITTTQKALKELSNDQLTSLMGETIYMGSGVPILKCNDDNKTIKCKIKVGTDSTSYKNVKVVVSDKKFVDGEVATGAKSIYSATLVAGTDYDFTINGASSNTVYWANLQNVHDGSQAWIESFSFKDQ